MNEHLEENLVELFADLPANLGGHMLLSVATVMASLAISLPLGILASRRPQLAESALAVAGVMQTLPSLALLALMMVLLGGMTGFWPAFLTLILYSILPILANTVIGIRGVDPALTEAAQGLGMSNRQMLWQVELPLAAPVILGGVRTATVMVVGTATLAAEIGGKSLGKFIFTGISTGNHVSTILGCITAAALAISLDQLVRLLEVAARRRSKRLAFLAAAALVLVVLGSLYEPITTLLRGEPKVVIACANFTEQYTLSRLLAFHLEHNGFPVERREGMGYGLQFAALRSGDIDCTVAYTGDVASLLMHNADAPRAEIERFLQVDFGVVYLGELGFENAYAIAVKKESGMTSINDLVDLRRKLKRPLKIAGDDGVFHRKEWRRVKEKYPNTFQDAELEEMNQTLTYGAKDKDAILAYTSDGRINAKGFVILDDPKGAFPNYDAILLLSRAAADRDGLMNALLPLRGAIRDATMKKANLLVDEGKQTPKQAAHWLMKKMKP